MSEDKIHISFPQKWNSDRYDALSVSAEESYGIPQQGRAWFEWKFREGPYGPAIICVATSTTGQIAGAVAYGRWRLTLGSATIDAALSYETFVHPAFRGQGLFVALADAAARRAGEEGVEVLFNFPNPSSRPGFLKLGWKDMGGIQTWIRPQSPMRIARAVAGRKRLSLGPLVAETTNRCPSEDQLPLWVTEVTPHTREGVLVSARSWELLRWRFFSHPINRYEIADVGDYGCIYRIGNRSGVREAQIMDILPTNPRNRVPPSAAAIRRLVKRITRGGRHEAVSLITTPGTEYASALPWAGFAKMPNRASFLCLPLCSYLEGIHSNSQWALTATDIHTF